VHQGQDADCVSAGIECQVPRRRDPLARKIRIYRENAASWLA